MTTKHARCAPSKAKQWLACPGSIYMADKYLQIESSEYAKEGTLAHEVAHDHVLTDHLIRGMGLEKAIAMHASKCIDDEMREHVAAYSRLVSAIVKGITPGHLALEHRFVLDDTAEIWGTADVAMLGGDNVGKRVGVIIDLKYGQGHAVDAENNAQLACYAAAMDADPQWGPIERAIVYIYQPRAEHPEGPLRKMRLSRADLDAWREKLLTGAKRAIKQADSGQPEFHAGEHCRWCPGEAVCAAKASYLAAEASVHFLPAETGPALPLECELSTEQIARIIRYRADIEGFLKRVEEFAQNKLLAGESLPGLKLVRGRSMRKWLGDEAVVAAELVRRGVKEPYNQKLKGITEIEKLKVDISDLTEKPEAPLKVAPESDKRPAVLSSAEVASLVFDEI